eukprot:995539-Alexandrium_andersonii.AAC.1
MAQHGCRSFSPGAQLSHVGFAFMPAQLSARVGALAIPTRGCAYRCACKRVMWWFSLSYA